MTKNKPELLNPDPLTFKKALLLCFFIIGIWQGTSYILYLNDLDIGLISSIIFLATVLITARGIGKDELSRILVWRDTSLPVFAALLLMFFGLTIVKSELGNFFQMLIPVPQYFFDNYFYRPGNVIMLIISSALFPAFTEEILFRGIIARRFSRIYSPRKAILLSAVLFGIMHINPWQTFGAFMGGIFYGWIYFRYKSIWLCMFMHAYHNILATLMPFPYIEVPNYYYEKMYRHPLWFDILGIFLFLLGLVTVIILGKEKKK